MFTRSGHFATARPQCVCGIEELFPSSGELSRTGIITQSQHRLQWKGGNQQKGRITGLSLSLEVSDYALSAMKD